MSSIYFIYKKLCKLNIYNKIFPIVLNCLAIFMFYLIVSSQVNARQVSIGSSNLPYTASTQHDTITFSASKITTSGSGIYVTADYVTIDLRNDTLEFGTGYGTDQMGIYTTYNIDHLTILGNATPNNGGLILHGGGINGSDTSWDCECIYIVAGNSDITITNVNSYITGFDGHNIETGEGLVPNIVISGGTLINRVLGYTNRMHNDGVAIKVSHGNMTLHDAIVDSWGHGIFTGNAGNGGVTMIYNCSIKVDARNDLYSYPRPNPDNSWETSLGAGCIDLLYGGPGTKIYNNKLVAGEDNEGCAGGVGVSYCHGTEENPIEIYNNYFNLHRGPDDYYGQVTARPYKQRWENKYVKFFDNTIVVTAYHNHPTHPLAYGNNVEGFDLTLVKSGDASEEGAYRDSFCVFERNHITSIAGDDGCNAIGMRVAIRGENESPPWNFTGAGNIIRNNYWGVSSSGLEFGKSDGGLCHDILIVGDTIEVVSPNSTPFQTIRSGDWGGPCTDNVVRDMVYLGGAVDTNIGWDYYSAGSDLSYEVTLHILAMGNNDTAIVNAAYTVKNKFNQVVASGFTNSDGKNTAFIRYYHAIYSSDNINYNNFTVVVEKDGHSDTKTMTLNSLSTKEYLSPTFNLDIPGTSTTEIDNISPGRVQDLRETVN